MYEGPALSRAEVALLRQAVGASVIALDAKPPPGSSWTILPGVHDVLLRVRIHNPAPNVNWTVWTYCYVRFAAVAGGSYESAVRVSEETASGLGEKLTMEIGIASQDGALIAKAHSCSAKRPPVGE